MKIRSHLNIKMSGICCGILGALSLASAEVAFQISNTGAVVANKTSFSLSEYGLRFWTPRTISPNWSAAQLYKGSYSGTNLTVLTNTSAYPLAVGAQGDLVQDFSNIFSVDSADLLQKIGHCNSRVEELPMAMAIDYARLQQLIAQPGYYDEGYRYKGGDSLGRWGTRTSGIGDTWIGETQLQVAIPSKSWALSNSAVTFDQNNGGKGPLLWMALSAVQELVGVDQQILMAQAMKESWMLTNIPVVANVGMGELTPFQITALTYDDLASTYSQLYPYGLTFDRYLGAVGAAEGLKTTEGELAVNGAISTALLMKSYHQQLMAETDLAYPEALRFSGNRHGLCFVSAMYNAGPGGDVLHKALLPDAMGGQLSITLADPSCATLSSLLPNFGNYISSIETNLSVMAAASKDAANDSKIQIVDRWITWDDVVTFWFGKNGSPTMATKDQQGGLLLHTKLGITERQALWDDLKRAFDLLSAHWPTQSAKPVMSLRYDWLSFLRIGKSYLSIDLQPTFPSWRASIINEYNQGVFGADGYGIDRTYPHLHLGVPQVKAGALELTADVQDPWFSGSNSRDDQDRGLWKLEWTTDSTWQKWQSGGIATKAHTNPRVLTGDTLWRSVQLGLSLKPSMALNENWKSGTPIWVRAVDACGNATFKTLMVPETVTPLREVKDYGVKSLPADLLSLTAIGVDGRAVEVSVSQGRPQLGILSSGLWLLQWRTEFDSGTLPWVSVQE